MLVPESLENRRKGWIHIGQILEFVYGQDDFFRKVFMLYPIGEEIIPVCKFDPFQPIVFKGTGNRGLKSSPEFGFGLFVGNEIDGLFVSDKGFDKGGLTHPPSAI